MARNSKELRTKMSPERQAGNKAQAERMKIPKFKSEAEEADWLYAHRKQIERRLRNAKPVLDANGKPMSAVEIVAAYSRTQKKRGA